MQDWQPLPDTDAVVSNAASHWVPEHRQLLVESADGWCPGPGSMQVPGNFQAPSHRAVRSLAISAPWAEVLPDPVFRDDQVDDPAGYAVMRRIRKGVGGTTLFPFRRIFVVGQVN